MIVKSFLIALQFLTVVPVKIKTAPAPKDFGRALSFFPLIGMLIGILLALILFIFSFLPHLVLAAVILTSEIIITGAIHLDGFADTCDGLAGAKTKERSLEIMRDSRIGTMAVIGLVCILLLKYTLLISLPKEFLWKALVLMPLFSRWAQVFACYLSDYARQEGKARYFVEFAGKKEILIATLFILLAFLLFMSIKGLFLCLIGAATIFFFISYIKRKIGGMTGDTIGATNEVAEVILLLFALIFLKINL